MTNSRSSRARGRSRARRTGRRAVLALALIGAMAGLGARASADPYIAPHGKVLVGVTGGRTVGGYVRAAGKPPAVFQFFVAWGDRFRYAYRRAADARAGLMVHLSTYNGPGTVERITPQAIAQGRGDRHLLALARDFAAHDRPVYLRLFSEMNNAANPYCAYDAKGRSRGAAHSRAWFRQAWRRVALVVKGGSVATIDVRLRALGMPRLRHTGGLRRLARPHVALQWAPMTAGSPDIPANRPDGYWPGGEYVDWVGTDFYSRFPNFAGLDRFYTSPRYRGKPFVFGEWGMWGRDDPGFMGRFFDWVAVHPRVRMLAYNQGNHPASVFRLYRYPRAAEVMRRALRSSRYTGRPHPGPGLGGRRARLLMINRVRHALWALPPAIAAALAPSGSAGRTTARPAHAPAGTGAGSRRRRRSASCRTDRRPGCSYRIPSFEL
jgi:hypothetical protein